MNYIVYTSNSKDKLREKDLEQLLFQCQRNNSRNGITGLLLYIDGKFVQVLEGDKEKLEEVFKKIQLDHRHEKVNKLIEGESKKRNYSNWAMGYKSLMPEEVMERLGYRDPEAYFKHNKITEESHVTELFMRLFYDKHFNHLVPKH